MRYRAKTNEMKAQRVLRGYTQADVAQALGWHQPYMSDLEMGRITINRERALAISRFIKTSIGNIFEKSCPLCRRPL
jgi:DNA-binding XRE family transcriptional regulator